MIGSRARHLEFEWRAIHGEDEKLGETHSRKPCTEDGDLRIPNPIGEVEGDELSITDLAVIAETAKRKQCKRNPENEKKDEYDASFHLWCAT